MISTLILALAAVQDDGDFVPMFNGKDLSGWVNANCAPETWSMRDGVIHCTGVPTGALRTEKQYENFILEAEWRHLKPGGNSGIFVWGTPISAPGVPFLRGIEVQVLDNGFSIKGKNEWYTTHGDVFPIHGATMKPLGKHHGQRSFPSEERSKPSPEWNHYRIVAKDGSIRLHVNGKEVSGGDQCNYQKGYLALESEGSPVEFRNVRIRELPSSNPPAERVAPLDEGFRPVYTGTDLRNWKDAAGRWKASDWVLRQTDAGGSAERRDLESEAAYGDVELIVDVKLNAIPQPVPALKVRGGPVPLAGPDSGPGKWTRLRVLAKGKTLTATANGKELPGLAFPAAAPEKGPIVVPDLGGGVDVANVFIRTP
jgi:hypothetical protein